MVGPPFTEELQPLPAVDRRHHFVAGIGQYGLEDLGNAEFIVDHQDERHPNPHCHARLMP
jgi:hypothetical protein